MTAAVSVRVPGQARPPAIEQTDTDRRQRWQLVDAAQAGDREAFAELYRIYGPMVYRVALRRCGNHHLAEDLTGDVFVKALRNISGLKWQGSDPGAWFMTITRNLVVDHFKSGRYRTETLDPEPGTIHGQHPPDRSPEGRPEELVVSHLTNLTLIAAVQQLNPEQRECITLRFLQGLSIAEVAAAMDRNEGAVKALQYRATKTLARLLPPGFETPEVPR
ncbi:sigma-70 family RNA polymerase sigma factor [Micromonospora chokoriensis]|uniref:sigma-70 family RNA polymerase sigma factor n=1 Tax=Micromonospora chokoriensis TaxID=356851 RepID=UPI00068AD8D7|nr:sigma-70 family RNA polymerase sigma factor [Micromonospora chokoriensis]